MLACNFTRLPVLQTSSPDEQPAAPSAVDAIPSPRSPVAPSTYVPTIVPFRLKDTAVRRPAAAITNGPMTVFGPPISPDAGPAAIASAPDFTPFTTPSKAADAGLDYDELEDGEEMFKLQQNYKASKALANISNRDGNNDSLTAKTRVSPLDLSKMAEKGVQIRQASAQLSRPNKLLGQENEAQAIC